MEYFDVYDINKNKLGYKKARGESLEEHEYNTGVEIWIFNDNKLLLTQRSLNKSHPGQWEVPGGCSQTNETSTMTLIRELKEEINLDINNNYRLLTTQIYKKQFIDIYTSNISINLKNIKLQEEEINDIKLVTKEEFISMAKNNEIVNSVLKRYKKIENLIENEW